MQKLFVGALAFASAVAGARADTVDLNYLGTGAGGNVSLFLTAIGSQDVFAGQLRHHMANGTGSLATFNGDFITFCPDVYQHVNSNVNLYTLTDLQDLPVVNPPVATMGALRASVLNTLYCNYGVAAETTSDNEMAQAFQLAIWEIVYDWTGGPLDLANGDLTAGPLSGGTLGWLATFNASLAFPDSDQCVLGLGNPDHQDQLVSPAPGTLGLLGTAGLMSRRRRR